jgi:hypothetical protein
MTLTCQEVFENRLCAANEKTPLNIAVSDKYNVSWFYNLKNCLIRLNQGKKAFKNQKSATESFDSLSNTLI